MGKSKKRSKGGEKAIKQAERKVMKEKISEKVKRQESYSAEVEEKNVVELVENARTKMIEFRRLKEEFVRLGEEEIVIREHMLKIKEKKLEIVERLEEIENEFKDMECEAMDSQESQTKETAERETALPAGKDKEGAVERSKEGARDKGEREEELPCGEKINSRKREDTCTGESAWLTNIEVEKVRKLLYERDRIDKERNIVIKGVEVEKDKMMRAVRELCSDKLGIEVNIEACWRGGKVIIARLGSVEEKRKVMRNKKLLKGSSIFIRDDLCYEDRKIQEEINRWAFVKRREGLNVRTGRGTVCIEDVWISWRDKIMLRNIEMSLSKMEGNCSGESIDVNEYVACRGM